MQKNYLNFKGYIVFICLFIVTCVSAAEQKYAYIIGFYSNNIITAPINPDGTIDHNNLIECYAGGLGSWWLSQSPYFKEDHLFFLNHETSGTFSILKQIAPNKPLQKVGELPTVRHPFAWDFRNNFFYITIPWTNSLDVYKVGAGTSFTKIQHYNTLEPSGFAFLGNHIYVASWSGNYITSFSIGVDGKINKAQTVSSCIKPRGMTILNIPEIQPPLYLGYVPCELSNNIGVYSIDPISGDMRFQKNVDTGGINPIAIAVYRPKNQSTAPYFLYVSNMNSNDISIFKIAGKNAPSPGDMKFVGRVSAGVQTFDLVIDNETATLYVGAWGSNQAITYRILSDGNLKLLDAWTVPNSVGTGTVNIY